MNKISHSKARYCIQSEKHPFQTTLGLCSLMEHQSLVDIAICCGNNILHAHKAVLAASSPLFREEFERNPGVEQVVISGCDFTVIRCLIEFMYCGETVVADDSMRYLLAAAKLFQMKNLENLSMESQFTAGDLLVLPKPQFLSKKPKYPVYPFAANVAQSTAPKTPAYNLASLFRAPAKPKQRKYRFEAEHQACVKEAQASILAIANLKKEIASAPQANTFIIEETCTETTVENFIPHVEEAKSDVVLSLTADKIKTFLGNDADANVEIMFKTSEGDFVSVTDEVLQNLQKDGLQYQVIDEEGHVGELQELKMTSKENAGKDHRGVCFLSGDLENSVAMEMTSKENAGKDRRGVCFLSGDLEDAVAMKMTSTKENSGKDHQGGCFLSGDLGDDIAMEMASKKNAGKDLRDVCFMSGDLGGDVAMEMTSKENSGKGRRGVCFLSEELENGGAMEMTSTGILDMGMGLGDVKPLFEPCIPEGFEVVPNFFPEGVSSEAQKEASGSGLKFSPDIFFADHDDENSANKC